jgi:hypothetical protein
VATGDEASRWRPEAKRYEVELPKEECGELQKLISSGIAILGFCTGIIQWVIYPVSPSAQNQTSQKFLRIKAQSVLRLGE